MKKTRHWSRLQKRLYNLVEECINLQVHCVVYPMESQRGSAGLPRYWITLDKEIIWDYPKQLLLQKPGDTGDHRYPHENDISLISGIIEKYISTSPADLMNAEFPDDAWGLADILRAADRRIGRRRLNEMRDHTQEEAVKKIIHARLKKQEEVIP